VCSVIHKNNFLTNIFVFYHTNFVVMKYALFSTLRSTLLTFLCSLEYKVFNIYIFMFLVYIIDYIEDFFSTLINL
jgi:hypothetical protein